MNSWVIFSCSITSNFINDFNIKIDANNIYSKKVINLISEIESDENFKFSKYDKKIYYYHQKQISNINLIFKIYKLSLIILIVGTILIIFSKIDVLNNPFSSLIILFLFLFSLLSCFYTYLNYNNIKKYILNDNSKND